MPLSLSEMRTHHSEKWRGFPEDVLPLPVAEMDFPIAKPIQDLLIEMIKHSDLGYLGSIPELGNEFGSFAKRRWNWQVIPEYVRLATDVGVGMVEVLRTIAKPGDRVLINSPIYQNFYNWLSETQLNIFDVPFKESETSWELDMSAIEEAYKAGVKVHALCNPHNPLGRLYSRNELVSIADLAAKYGVIVLSDEIHAPLTYDFRKFIPFLSVNENAANVGIVVTSASKGWNLAGLKSAMIITQVAERHKQLDRLPMAVHFRSSLLGAFAAVAAFRDGEAWLNSAVATIESNARLLANQIQSQVPAIKFKVPECSYLAWLDCSALDLGEDPAKIFLEKGRVAFNSGVIYSPHTPQFVRFNFATSESVITEAINRIVKSL